MKSICLAAGLGALALASPVDNARSSSRLFELSNFYFTGSPHSVSQYYNFDLKDHDKVAHCGTTSSISSGLYPFGLTPCNATAWSFSFLYRDQSKPKSGYILTVTEALGPKCNATGTKTFKADAVKLVIDPYNPNGNYYALEAPATFNMTAKVLHERA